MPFLERFFENVFFFSLLKTRKLQRQENFKFQCPYKIMYKYNIGEDFS